MNPLQIRKYFGTQQINYCRIKIERNEDAVDIPVQYRVFKVNNYSANRFRVDD